MNKNKILEFIKLEDRVLFEAAAVAEIVEAQANDPNADMNHSDQQAQDEKNAIKNAPVENQADAEAKTGAPAALTQPEDVANIDAQIQALIEGEISAPVAGTEAADALINEIFNDYGANAVSDAIHDIFAEAQHDDLKMTGIHADTTISTGTEHELVVINSSVQDMDQIIDSLGTNQEVLVLENGKDAMQQINEYLEASGKEYSAIHIVSHGNSGYITLAGERYDVSNFDAADWAAVGGHLSEGGDILFYGCNLAENQAGQDFIALVADAAHADVAASTNTTGLGGDWTLEYNHGTVETASITVDGYDYSLLPHQIIITTDANSGAGSLREAFATINSGTDLEYELEFQMSGNTISLSTLGEMSITRSGLTISIDGSLGGSDRVTLNASGSRIFNFGSGNTVTIENMRFTNGSAGNNNGGAIYMASGSLEVINSYFNLNRTGNSYQGGAIYLGSGDVEITDSNFKTNWSGQGGAVFAAAGDVITKDSTFETNYALKPSGVVLGGAIYANGNVSDTGSTFNGNYAQNSQTTTNRTTTITVAGGAIYSATASLTGTTFTNNNVNDAYTQGSLPPNSSMTGGAIHTTGDLVLSNVSISGSKASTAGGAVYTGGNLTITGASSFTDNHVDKTLQHSWSVYGGAIYVGKGLTIDAGEGNRVRFENNSVFGTPYAYGGAIYVANVDGDAVSSITGADFIGNSANKEDTTATSHPHGDGGALWLNTVTVINDSNFINNTTYNEGGAIWAWQKLTINDSYFTGNDSFWGGAVLFNSIAIIENSTFDSNIANEGGAIAIRERGNKTYQELTIIGSTFTSNLGTWNGGAISFGDYTIATRVLNITDSDFTGNYALGKIVDDQTGKGLGGAIHISTMGANGVVTLNINGESNFTGNKAVGGGAIYILGKAVSGSTVVISGNAYVNIGTEAGSKVTFSGNEAYGFGGQKSVSAYSGAVTVLGTTVNMNIGTGAGSTVDFTSNKSGFTAASGSDFASTTTGYGGNGGAIYTSGITTMNIGTNGGKVTFTTNSTAGSGGAIYVTGSTMVLTVSSGTGSKVDFTQNIAKNHGGAIYAYGGGATMTIGSADSTTTFDGNQATNRSGAVHAESYWYDTNVTVTKAVFKNNTAGTDGGALFVHSWNTANRNTYLTVTGGTEFTNNQAKGHGGAIYGNAQLGNLSATIGNGTTFSKNTASSYGGAIYAYAGTTLGVSVTGTSFDTNIGTSFGGAIYAQSNGTSSISITGSTFNANKTNGNGGAIFMYTNGHFSLNITGSTFNGNSAANGGAVYAYPISGATANATLTVDNSVFKNNTANSSGAIYFRGSGIATTILNISNSTFEANKALSGDAGAIWTWGNLTVTNTNFYRNTATSKGGAIYDSYGSVTVNGGTFDGNSAVSGGAIHIDSLSATNSSITGATFLNNKATAGSGGAVWVGASGNLTVSHSEFRQNSASVNGGAVYAAGAKGDMDNSLFADNSATGSGGAIYFANASVAATLVNLTVANNSAKVNGGGIYAVGGDKIWVYNSILWNNLANGAANQFVNIDVANKVWNSGIQGWTGGHEVHGNINLQADNSGTTRTGYYYVEFVDAANTDVSKRDYRLSANSYAINRGDNDKVQSATDLAKQDRIYQVPGDTLKQGIVDIGAYESNLKGNLIVTLDPVQKDITYGDSATLNSSRDGYATGNNTYSSGDESFVSIDGNKATAVKAGGELVEITATYGDSYWQAINDTATVNTVKRDISLQAVGGTYTYDGKNHQFTWDGVIGKEGLASWDTLESYDVDSYRNAGEYLGKTLSNVLIVNGSDIKMNDNYNIDYGKADMIIKQADLMVYGQSDSFTYDAQNHNYSWDKTLTSGLVDGDVIISATVNGFRNAGSWDNILNKSDLKIENAGNENVFGNYNITLVKGTVTIGQAVLVITRDGSDKVYDANTNANYTWSFDVLGNDKVTYHKGTAAFLDKNVGENKTVTFSGDSVDGADAGNYRIVYNDLGADITKATLVITRDGSDKVYNGGTDAQYTWSFNAIGNDEVVYNEGTAAFLDKNVGENKTVTFSGDSVDGADAGNYRIVYNDLGADITKATLVITRDGSDKVYNGGTDAQYTWSFNAIGNDEVVYNEGTAAFLDKNVGENKTVTFSGDSVIGLDAGNYDVVYNDLGADITKATLVITRDGSDKVYNGGTDAQYTWSFNAIGNDKVIYNEGTAAFLDKNVGENKTVTFSGDSVTGADAGNYDVVYNDLGADITKATLVITRDGSDKAYNGGTDAQYTWSFSAIGNDKVVYNEGTAAFLDKNVGENKTVTFSGDSVTGLDAGNYDVVYNDLGADITKATLVITRDGSDKVYNGGTDAQYTWSFNAIGNDNVIYNEGTAAFLDKNVGENKTVTFTGDSISGADAGNYDVIYNDLGADITKATLVVNRDGSDKVYDGNTNANYTWSFDGKVNGDKVTYDKGTAAFLDKNAGSGKEVIFSGDNLGGADLGNYDVVYNDNGADITKATLTIVINDQSKNFGTVDPAFTGTATGLVGGDSVDGYNRTDKGETSGKYAIDQYQLHDDNGGQNYNVTVINGTLTIGEAARTNIYMDAASKNYVINGMDQASLVQNVSVMSANREADTVLDTETSGNVNSVSHQTATRAGEKAKSNLREESQKKLFEETDKQVVQQRTNLTVKGDLFTDKGEKSGIVESHGKKGAGSKFGGVKIVVPAESNASTSPDIVSEHPMNHMPSQINLEGVSDVIHFSSVDLASVNWTEKADNLKDKLDIVLEEMMVV